MMEMKELLMDIRKELRCADKYAKEAMKHKEVNEKTVDHCLWKQTHEHMQEWYDKIKKCIDKYK